MNNLPKPLRASAQAVCWQGPNLKSAVEEFLAEADEDGAGQRIARGLEELEQRRGRCVRRWASPNYVDDAAEFEPGTRLRDHRGGEYVYAAAAGDIGPGVEVTVAIDEGALGAAIPNPRLTGAAPETRRN